MKQQLLLFIFLISIFHLHAEELYPNNIYPIVPNNDEPCSAALVNPNTDNSCGQIVSGTLAEATNSGVSSGCTGSTDDDVWFRFTATSTVEIISISNIVGSSTYLYFSLYTGSCDNLSLVKCANAQTSTVGPLSIGTEYFIQIYSVENSSVDSTFDVCVREGSTSAICQTSITDLSCSANFINNFTFSNSVDTPSIGSFACLPQTPNPSWFTLTIGSSGILEMEIKQTSLFGGTLDADFVAWGPFNDINNVCEILETDCPSCPNNTQNPDFYPFGNIVDCSYAAGSTEHLTIENAVAGEFYVILITNYSNQYGTTKLTQTNINSPNAASLSFEINVELGPNQVKCLNEETILNAFSPFADSYVWYKDGVVLADELSYELEVTESGVYSVEVYRDSCNSPYTDEVNVNFVDCENVGLIHINAFNDINLNSIFDIEESQFSNGYFTYELNSSGEINYIESSTGSFTLASPEETDSYDFAYYFYDEYDDCYNLSVATFENITVANGSEINIDFPIVDDQPCQDIAVYLIGNSSPRPDFNHTNYLTIQNLGLLTTSGSVDFLLDENLMLNSVSTSPNYTIITTSTGFTLNFVDLEPGNLLNVIISLNCPNSVNIDEVVTNIAELTTVSNEAVLENNASILSQTVIGSYDPNDIMESHGPKVVYDDFVASDEYLYYTIRFQNIGTAEAINVRIEDALDSQLDESTFQMLRSSHEYVVTRTNNQLVWQFDDINLPSESMDAEGSKGFVYFKIKPQSSYAIGDIIPNFADIYFDFNPPITTNTFTTEFVETLSIDEQSISSFSIFPNPANDVVNIKLKNASNGSFKVEVFDVQGKRILSQETTDAIQIELNVSEFESGLYFIKLANQSRESVHKLIIN